MKRLKSKKFQNRMLVILTHVGSLLPLALLLIDYFTDNLTANPIQAVTLRTGKAALVLLILSLACTPVCALFRLTVANLLRKPLGLYAFLYAVLHFLVFIWVDLGLNWAYIKDGFLQKPYALVGFSAFLILIPLAATSFKTVQKRMGKNWKRLHRFVYLAGVLVIVHYVWLVKSDYREPLAWGAGLAFLLLARVGPVKQWLLDRTAGIRTMRRRRWHRPERTSKTTAA